MGHSLKGRLMAIGVAALIAATFLGSCAPGGGGFGRAPSRLGGPSRLAMSNNFLDPYGHYLFIANSEGGTVAVVDAQDYGMLSANTNDLNDTDVIRVGRAPHDIALTPQGDRLFVTDASTDSVRVVSGWAGRQPDVFNVKVVFDPDGTRLLKYDILVEELPSITRAGEIAIQPYLQDGQTSVPVFITDRDNNRILVLDSETGDEVDQIALPGSPTHVAVSPFGRRLFVTTDDAMVHFVDVATGAVALDDAIFLDGDPTQLTTNRDGDELYVLNGDPPQIQIIDLNNPPTLYEPAVDMPARPVNMAQIFVRDEVYVSAVNGYVYVLDTDTQRICNSYGKRIFFRDEWPPSNPTLERIDVEDCVATTERWEIRYDILNDNWIVRGSVSGLQATRAQSNQFYRTDDGEVGFYIRDVDRRASDEDRFYFETDVGTAPIRVGLVPDGVAVTPFFLNPQYDIIYVASPGSDNLSVVISDENARVATVR
ncbi:MAG: beta-propeller fold lactonase family protein [Deltaproteobacteria bacterium]|nr:beta-propeller fold lactonase family protein [Deltaproteobacteria bacterium]MCB9487593.1 beta-propeller fold lactonase family protein [Deltaproteobacteria bacterium]